VDDAGELGCGVTANHWYNLGWRHVMRIPASASATWEEHPQSGHLVAGRRDARWLVNQRVCKGCAAGQLLSAAGAKFCVNARVGPCIAA
jgi:hypothetical protein